MKMRWMAFSLSALLLAGCSTPVWRGGATFDRVNQEMKDAVAANKAPGNDAINQAMMPSLDIDPPKSAAKIDPRFDLAVNGAPAAQVFGAIVSGTRYSMLVPPEVGGTISLNLKNVTVREALETIRDLYGYDFLIKGTRIFVQPNTMQTRIFQINYLSSRRQGVSDTRVTSSSPSVVNPSGSTGGAAGTAGGAAVTQPSQPGSPGSVPMTNADSARVQTRSDADFWRDIQLALNAIVGNQDGRSVILNAHSGVLLIRAMPNELRAVENYLRATQVMVERQVMLEAKIVEVVLNESYQTGINWAKFGNVDNKYTIGVMGPSAMLDTSGAISANAGGITGGTGVAALPGKFGAIATNALGKGFFGLAFQTASFAALLSFLETQGDSQVLSSPRIATMNNQKAVLKVGTDDYFVTNISTSTTASGSSTVTTPTITLQPFFSGVALDVTPQIDDEGYVILHIHPSVTVVQEKQKTVDLGSLGTFNLPLASSSINETDSIVRVQDGYIVAIGGLMSQEQNRDRNGLPGLSSAPGIGALFGQRGGLLRKRELVVLLKPTVIQNESSWKQDLIDTQERLERLDPRQRPPLPQ